MNPWISRLHALAQKEERLIIGLMSGTSLDGLDVALCRFRKAGTQTRVRLENFRTVGYREDLKAEIRSVFARPQVDLQQLCMLHPWLGKQHGLMVLNCLENWGVPPGNVDLIASHGQTVFHAPAWMHRKPEFGHATLQIGDSDQIAVTSGIITLGDFRQKHIAAGGEGAPLAVYGDYLLYCSEMENRVLLNIGGIANYTFLPADCDVKKVYATDIGPGNTLIDAAVRKFFHKPFDAEGSIARSGKISEPLLSALKDDPFFSAPVPKTTGPELFNLNYLEQTLGKTGIKTLSPADLIASLTAFSASVTASSLEQLVKDHGKLNVYLSGGGMHNAFLTGLITDALPSCTFDTTKTLGIDPDAKEAVLFAALANETVAGDAQVFEGNRSGIPALSMGKISLPA